MPKRTKKHEEKLPSSHADEVTPLERPALSDAEALSAAINAPPEDPGGHRRAAIIASATIDGDPLCRICGSRMSTEVCSVDGWRFEAGQ